jgi:hypothetical protein
MIIFSVLTAFMIMIYDFKNSENEKNFIQE